MRRMQVRFRASMTVLLLAVAVVPAFAGQPAPPVLFVDSALTMPACSTYLPAKRLCTGGTEAAVNTLRAGAARAVAGTTVVIRGGVFTEPLVPGASGTSDRPIVFRNMDGESVVISGIDGPAIQLISRSHIVIRGLMVTDSVGWGRIQDSRENTIEKMTFLHATAAGTTGGLKIVRSIYNHILENRFEDGNDSLMIQDDSNGNVVSRNVFKDARHTLVCIKCSSGNIVRNNVLGNAHQKAMEIFDCEKLSDAPLRLDATKRNIVEQNIFTVSRAAWNTHDKNAIQHGGQYTIVRRNVFLKALGGGVAYQSYATESLFVYGNRLYNNTFYDNRCFGLIGFSGDSRQYRDNRAVNNLFYKNTDCEGRPGQVSIDDRASVITSGNAVETSDPGFVDEAKPDLRLKSDSRMIDRAGPLTVTRSAGEGTAIPVDDVLWFTDGMMIPGESGDEIQLLGAKDSARIVRIDFATRTLTLDHALAWQSGQGVALKFTGAAPDFGAAEYDAN